ncbi:MAG TPA: DUF488 family protein [Streptosporangiaceae bacterium]|nr:DUF488 family protein [Streptosporangiaceae bacterium]
MVRFQLEDGDYQRLLRLRTSLRQYLRWSEQQAQAVGLTPAHHQLLLAVRGHDDPRGPTISDVAGYLLLRHHSTVELAQRVGALGLIRRVEDPDDGRVVRLKLTGKGAAALDKLAALHLEELSRLAGDLRPYWQGHMASRIPGSAGPGNTGMDPVRARRIYDDPGDDDGTRVLVDRLWPRGIRKDAAPLDQWLAEVAPSTQLRRWYGHKPERFSQFTERYLSELRSGQASEALNRLCDLARRGPLTLLTATKDLPRSGAAVLAEEIRRRTGTATS